MNNTENNNQPEISTSIPTPDKTNGAGTILWERYLSGLEDCQINIVYPVTGVGCLVAGSTATKGSGKKAWMAAMDNNGQVAWELIYGEGAIFDLKPVKEGGYLAFGIKEVKTEKESGQQAYLLKINEIYGVEWESEIGLILDEKPEYSGSTMDGGYFFSGTIEMEDTGDYKVWIKKLDSFGNIQWVKIFGEGEEENVKYTCPVKDGVIVLGTTLTDDGYFDGWIRKFDTMGNQKWIWPKEGALKHYMANCVQPDNDGSLMFAGTKFNEENDSWQIWVLKLEHDGKTDWSRVFGVKNNFQAYFVYPTQDRGYILTGEIWSKNETDRSTLVIKFDSEGSKVWVRSYKKEEDCVATRIYPDNQGGYYMTGYLKSRAAGKDIPWVWRLAGE